MIEEIFEIKGNDGLVRRGIVSLQATHSKLNTGLLLLPAGLKYHVGPNRYYVHLARILASSGYCVLRFDPSQIGESDGYIEPASIPKVWRSIEEGRFVDDTLLAASIFRDRYSLTKLIIGGLCGGAITAQMAAALSPSLVNGVISINTAVSLSCISKKKVLAITQTQAERNTKAYLQKIFSVYAWLRLLQGSSSFTDIRATFFMIIRKYFKIGFNQVQAELDSHINPLFMQSFKKMQNEDISHLLIFSGNDNRWLEFQDFVLTKELNSKMQGKRYIIKTIPQANHELHLQKWKNSTYDIVKNWLRTEYSC